MMQMTSYRTAKRGAELPIWRKGSVHVVAAGERKLYPLSFGHFTDDDAVSTFEIANAPALMQTVQANWGSAAPGPAQIEGPALILAEEGPDGRLHVHLLAIGIASKFVVFHGPAFEKEEDRRLPELP